MNEDVAITTEDNPFDPFLEFTSWLSYDIQQGYCTCERLAAIVHNLPEALTNEENNFFVNEAIDELIAAGTYNKAGHFIEYKKVFRNSKA